MISKILFYYHTVPELKCAWEKKGFQVFEADEDKRGSAQSLAEIVEEISVYCKQYDIDMVFTFDFSPDLAEACHRMNVIYISWIVDCPHSTLWTREAKYPTNYIFEFDYTIYQRLINKGLDHVWYLPLAAATEDFQDVIQRDKGSLEERYKSDVAFVGNLYTEKKHSLYDQITYLPPWLRGYVDALICAQRKVWGADLLGEAISDEAWGLLSQYIKWDLGNRYDEEVYKISILNVLAQKITQLERKEVCSYLAHHFDFALYTGSDTSFDPVIINKGYADYLTQMPLIFHYSKINIHITVRSIPSAVPLRVLDVLACEGFLLTNYQPEIAEYFEDGKELVIYSDFQDMYAKIAYYLEHEEERQQIAHAGFLKVREYFNYAGRIDKMLQILEESS